MGGWDRFRRWFGSDADGGAEDARAFFLAEVEAAVQAIPDLGPMRRQRKAFDVRVGESRPHTLHLTNLFIETRELDPDARRARIVEFVIAATRPPTEPTWDEARPRLFPVVRPSSTYAGMKRYDRRIPIQRRFAPSLVESVALDTADRLEHVDASMLERWGVSADAAFAAAIENARATFTGDVEPFDPTAPYPIWHVSVDDGYESSRVLVPGWLASFAGRVAGRPIAILPHRSALVVGGDGDERCLRRLVASARAEYGSSPRPISPLLYTVDDGGAVVPFVLPAGHPLADETAASHCVFAAMEYGAQKESLEASGEEFFVATFNVVERPDKSVFSAALWTETVRTLLPQADFAVLRAESGGARGKTMQVPWAALMAIAGSRLVAEPGLDPPRWRTASWPDAAQLARLAEVAVR